MAAVSALSGSLTKCFYPECATQSEQVQRCSKCFSAVYCSREHQVSHWPEHRKVCVPDFVRSFLPTQAKGWVGGKIQGDPWKEKNLRVDPAPHPHFLEFLRRGLLKSGDAIDLGCGNGRNAGHLASSGWSVTALDSSPGSLDLIKKGKNLVVKQQDLNESQSLPEGVDLILCYDVFNYLDPLKLPALFESIGSSLKSGGYITGSMISDPADPAYIKSLQAETTHDRARALWKALSAKALGSRGLDVEAMSASVTTERVVLQLEMLSQSMKSKQNCWYINSTTMFEKFLIDSGYEVIQCEYECRADCPMHIRFIARKK